MSFPLNNINWVGLPESQYYKQEFPKKQIVLHHTASGRGADGDIRWWLSDPLRIATCIIIDHDGVYQQLFNSRYWGHHLGMRNKHNLARNRESIAIEIDSWGPLYCKGGKFYSYTGTEVSDREVQLYTTGFGVYPDAPFFKAAGIVGQTCYYYQKYNNAQLVAVQDLLRFLCDKYNIPTKYHPEMWAVSQAAIKGEPGVWTHVSYRADKTDCHPQPELIQVLKTL